MHCERYGAFIARRKAKKKNYKVWIKSATDHIHNIAVQGPNSRKILEKFVWTPPAQPTINELQWFRFTIARMNDHVGVPIIVSRTGYTGELGYEIVSNQEDGIRLWHDLVEKGAKPIGLAARDTLRLEAGLNLYGVDMSLENHPYESNLGWSIDMNDESREFIGKNALLAFRETQTKLIGFYMFKRNCSGSWGRGTRPGI